MSFQRNQFKGLEFPFSSYKEKTPFLHDQPKFFEEIKVTKNLLNEDKENVHRFKMGAESLEKGKSKLASDPLSAIGNLSVANIALKGFEKVKSLNFSALAYARVYDQCKNRKTFDFPSVSDEIKENNDFKKAAVEMLNQANALLNKLEESAAEDGNNFENLQVTFHMLRAANCYVQAELYLISRERSLMMASELKNEDAVKQREIAESELASSAASYVSLQSHLLKAKAEEFHNYYPRARTRYAFILTQQNNPKERAADIYFELEKKYWSLTDKSKNGLDAGDFFNDYGDWLNKEKHYHVALTKYDSARKIFETFGDHLKVKSVKNKVKIILENLRTIDPVPVQILGTFNVQEKPVIVKKESFFNKLNFKFLFKSNKINEKDNSNTETKTDTNSALVRSKNISYGTTDY